MKYLSITKRSMIVKWLFAIHFICLTICAVLLFSLKRSEHLRWGLGYMIVWVTILSSLVLFFLINKQFKHWLLLKIYCVVFFVARNLLQHTIIQQLILSKYMKIKVL